MNIRIYTAEAAAAPVSKSDLRSQRALVRSATKELNRQQKALDKLEERFAKQNPGAGAAPRNPEPSATAQPEADLTGISRRELVKMLVESRKLDKPTDARGVPVADLRALFLKKRKPRGPRPSPATRRAKPTVQPTSLPTSGGTVKLKDVTGYSDDMTGPEWQATLNGSAKAPRAKVEGYWRNRRDINKPNALPFPVKFNVPGFDKKAFLAALTAAQNKAKETHSKGSSPHRWTNEPNGTSEYQYKGWRWPAGYIKYIRAGVPPTQAFYKFLMGKDLPGLPKYPRTMKS